MVRPHVYGEDYDMYSTVASTVLGSLPAMLGAGALYAGIKRPLSGVEYQPVAKRARVVRNSPYSVVIRPRHFGLFLRKSTRRGTQRRYSTLRRFRNRLAISRRSF